ncbi:BT_3987 domain-containing protein [Capnocytophaga leadbetteri]|uniref:BT_3987 domain-containing protein n=1 Tax=Capnocytophaga leadbetteri TaxID=327575 RepID=UPI0028E72003|nr:DUF1735 domain-containing protein [Capnocytophaga leadbetteri]
MKNIFVKIAAVVFLIGGSACQKKLDTVDGTEVRNYSAVYMNKEITSIAFANFTAEGDGQVEISMSNIKNNDVAVTISAVDFLPAYNAKNNTNYTMLPKEEFVLYEKGNESNRSTNGTLQLYIPQGKTQVQVGIKVKSLASYSMKTKYAIPLRIVSASLPMLTNKETVVAFDRPLKTSAAKIKQGYGFGVKLDPASGRAEEFTLQGQFLFTDFHSYNGENVNMSLIQGPLPYTRVSKNSIQVKDGGGDSPEDFAKVDLVVGQWYQITFVYKNDYLKLYVNGTLIKTYLRPGLKINPGMQINVENVQTSFSALRYFREFRVWNRALSEAEIKGDMYLPVSTDSKGLIAYLSFEKQDGLKDLTKYNNTVIFRKGTSDSKTGDQSGDRFVKEIDETTFMSGMDWEENIKFPAKGLEYWN